MNTVRSMFAGAALLALPAEAQEHRFEDDPVVMVRENFVACDVLSQLQRVMDNPRFLLSGECDPVRAGDRVRVYARRGPYVCIYPHDTVSPCKWTHERALATDQICIMGLISPLPVRGALTQPAAAVGRRRGYAAGR